MIGTNSVRRQAQLLHARPDLRTTLLRGNVQSRIDKIMNGAATASFLALAGLRRLGIMDAIPAASASCRSTRTRWCRPPGRASSA